MIQEVHLWCKIKISICSDICFNQISQIILLIIVAVTYDHKYFPTLIVGKHQCHFSPLKNKDSNASNSQQSKYNMKLQFSDTHESAQGGVRHTSRD